MAFVSTAETSVTTMFSRTGSSASIAAAMPRRNAL